MTKIIKHFSYETSQQNTPVVTQLKSSDNTLLQLTSAPRISHYREGKKNLHVTPHRGDAFSLCASHNKAYICCNVHVLDAVSNCPYDCSYCFLQNYLNNGTLQVTGDIDKLIAEIKQKTATQPWRFFRIGTWELGDSLALDTLTHHATELVEAFDQLPNAILELRTKSDCVDHLLNITPNNRTVVAWTINPETVVKTEEFRTASMEARLTAMEKVVNAGYLTALHFDPMIYYDDWKSGYQALVASVFEKIPVSRIAWISIGSLRFNPEMKRTIEQNFPGSKITMPEMVAGNDGKMRYVKPLRIEMYQHLYQWLNEYSNHPLPYVYFCMERWDVWEKVFGEYPKTVGELDYQMSQSLDERFPGLVHQKPDKALYMQADNLF